MAGTDYDLICKNLAAVGDLATRLQTSGLSDTAIQVLIKHKTGLPMTTIKSVLNSLGELSLWALAKKPPPK